MHRVAVALALVSALAGRALADSRAPATATAAAPSVEVTLHQKKPLRLVRWIAGKGDPGMVGLEGFLVVTLKNTGASPVRLRNQENHGLVFTSQKDGALRLVMHSCKCVADAKAPHKDVVLLRPGQVRSFMLGEWGCGGGEWPPPPPGSYEVTYRVLAAPDPAPAPAEGSVQDLIARCEAGLVAPATWASAASSAPLKVTLKKPVAKKLP